MINPLTRTVTKNSTTQRDVTRHSHALTMGGSSWLADRSS